MNAQTPAPVLNLSLLGGGGSASVALRPPGPLRLGRRSNCDLVLPDPASRDHALLVYDAADEQWCIIDTDSKHGTRLNGVPLQPRQKYPLRPHDLIDIRPCTLQLLPSGMAPAPGSQSGQSGCGPSGSAGSTVVQTMHDAESSAVSRINRINQDEPELARERLALLLRCAKAIHAADNEADLAEAILDAIVLGTGFANVAMLRPLGDDSVVDVIGSRGSIVADAAQPQLSRSLIHRASQGEAVRLTVDHAPADGASIVALGIDEAMCLPLMLGNSPAGFLYMDNRDHAPGRARIGDRGAGCATFGSDGRSRVAPDAAGFAAGIAQIASMATANFRRMDLERRISRLDAELAAAAEAQRWILPCRQLRVGRYCCTGENRPASGKGGSAVSGDFFDIIQLDKDRFALTLGDVVGKGIASSVLMTATQGFLHSAMLGADDPAEPVRRLNSFIAPRCDGQRFVTLWVGIFDTAADVLRYVDAGHGYGMLFRGGELMMNLREKGGPPIGIEIESGYETARVAIQPGDRVVLVSDGLVEQLGSPPGGGEPAQFGVENVARVVASGAELRSPARGREGEPGESAITALFHAVTAHAGTQMLADDATAALVEVAM